MLSFLFPRWLYCSAFEADSRLSSLNRYCVANCALTGLIYYLMQNEVHVTFSGQGHALMSLMVSYLVVSKVYLAFDRYMNARCAVGQAFSTLRELHECLLTFTARQMAPEARAWREKVSLFTGYCCFGTVFCPS